MGLDDDRLERVRELLQEGAEPLGERLGRFRLLESVGRGGMGVVHRAFDERLARTVAVKVLADRFSDDEERRKRFVREARAAAGLSHPNIVGVHEVGEEGGRVFIVMELVEGQNLRERLRAGPISVAQALRLARDIAAALGEAHERGVIHRDVKPENVIVTPDGVAKLADFGLAKVHDPPPRPNDPANADTAPAVTRDGEVMGTPGYMSPEQATGRAVDAQTDVFSLGVLLHEMIVGTAPFAAATPVESVVAIVRDDPPPPSSLVPGVPDALDRIVARCIAKQPQARYDDARAVLRDLDALLEGRAPSMPSRRRPRVFYAIAVAAGGAAILATAFALRRSSPAEAEAPPPASAATSAAPGVRGWDTSARACKDDAARDVRAGILELRGGNWARAHERFGSAQTNDPDCPQAVFRRVITGYFFDSPASIRETYRVAVKLGGGLSERDRLVLDAYEPILAREPIADKEYVARLVAVADRYPDDAELAGTAGFAVARGRRDWPATIALARRSLAIDPGYADAWQVLGRALAWGTGDRAGGAAAFDRCIEAAPLGTDCLEERAILHLAQGQCREMEAAARELSARDPKADAGYWFLGLAMASLGEPRTAVDEAMRQHAARVGEADRAIRGLFDRARVASTYGDFVEAEARLRELEPLLAGETTFGLHAEWALLSASLYVETRRPERALAVAETFAGKRRALTGNTYSFKAHIPSYQAEPFLLAMRARGGRMADEAIARERDDWVTWAQDLRNFDARSTWAYAVAELATTPGAAKKALATMPEGLDPDNLGAGGNLAAGRALILAGRATDALRYLRPGAAACRALEEPFARNGARSMLGQALEATGDRAGACAAYAEVLRDWRGAKPASRTLDEVEKRAAALKCR